MRSTAYKIAPIGVLLINFSAAVTCFASDWSTESVASQSQGYCSSYLPKSVGPLTHTPTPLDSTLQRLLQKKALSKNAVESLQIPAGLKYLNFAKQVKASKETLVELRKLLDDAYKPDAESWAGYCNRWSATAVDPKVAERLNQLKGGVVCGDLVFSEGEIKELTTFMNATTWGNGEFGQPSLFNEPDSYAKFLDESGLSDTQPSLIFDPMMATLSNGQGVIIDTFKGIPLWNYPVMAMHKSSRPLSQLASPSGAQKLLPYLTYKSGSSTLKDAMFALQKMVAKVDGELDYNLYGIKKAIFESYPKDSKFDASTLLPAAAKLWQQYVATADQIDARRAQSWSAFFQAQQDLAKEMGITRSMSYEQMRDQLANYIFEKWNAGVLVPFDGTAIVEVKLQLDLLAEVPYAQPGCHQKIATYAYYEIRRGSTVDESVWITSFKDQPDQALEVDVSATSSFSAILDIFHSNCRSLNDVP